MPPHVSGRWRLEHTYAELPSLFHADVAPSPVRDPQFVIFNAALATALGLDGEALDSPEGAAIFAGNTLPEGSRPLAQAYAGHQFGHFTPLGDGRAILLGEQITPDGGRVDVQLKGAGQTPYSRRGDGRAALGPMLRELVISEAMHALGIPTSRSLAVVSTGEPVYRERPLPGAVLTRVAASHLRVGTFEWAAAHRNTSALRALADYTVRRHYPAVADAAAPYLALFDAVAERQASLIAQWQLVGFVHGVMNTDNMSLAGETIDYGPCAFMDAYDPATVFSSIDSQGRYAYGNQPAIAQWNLARLAEAMLPLFDAEQARAIELANASIARFEMRFEHYWMAGMRAKLGLFTEEPEDAALVDALLTWMHDAHADFTNTFRRLSTGGEPDATMREDTTFHAWYLRWQTRLARQPQSAEATTALMRRSNPAVIPRNHTVEEALTAAAEHRDLGALERLLEALAAPHDHSRERPEFSSPSASGSIPYRTFCGT
ncbi:MAG: YdiU family protein [Acidobacteriota bacterium]|nr:YdiU family protein [Acidobacteriota bacterium]